MKRGVGVLGLAIALLVLIAVSAWSANSVTVETKAVAVGATGVTIGVFISNDAELTGLVLPLEFRTVSGGGYITDSYAFAVQGRVASSGLMDFPTNRVLGAPAAANSCSGPVSKSYTTDLAVDFASPDCQMWVGINTMNPNLAIGEDGGTPSFLFTVNVTSTDGGVFEIDTCCVIPGNHLEYVDDTWESLYPTFTKGVITIGNNAVHEIAGGTLPTKFALGQNYPNPFNAATLIPFEVGYDSHVRIDIYDILGRRIATVVDKDYEQGRYVADWNGTNSDGRTVATGVYFYRFSSDEKVTTRKMVLLK